MRVPIDHLHSAGRVLSGFNGATTLSVGDIAFSVKAGPICDAPNPEGGGEVR